MINKIILFHPFLFSLLFVITPYAQYANLIPARQVFLPLIILCIFALIMFFIIKRIVKKAGVAVAILTPILIVLLGYGILYDTISFYTKPINLNVPALILCTLIIMIILVVYSVKLVRVRENTVKKINEVFSAIACTLIVFSVFSIATQANATANYIGTLDDNDIFVKNHIPYLPDIYFIMLDEYAGPSQMKSDFSYDMTPFVEHLKKRGFMVTEMRTKYLLTEIILPSVLNMKEETNMAGAALSSSSFSSSLYSLAENMNLLDSVRVERMINVRNNRVIRFLKKTGYQFINMGSSLFLQTRYNQLADKNINTFGFQLSEELPAIILSKSVIRILFIERYFIYRYFYRTAVLGAFSELENLPENTGKPKFVFTHILCPHIPYVFGSNGENVGVKTDGADKGRYLDQHIFITRKVTELVDQLPLTSKRPPIIIIQADHGSRFRSAGLVRNPSDSAHKVFSAVYIPDYKGEPWPDSLPSYNTFPLIFNYLFGTNLDIHG